MKSRLIEALSLVALALDAINKRGKPDHAQAVKDLESAKKQWRDQRVIKCRHCGKIP